MYVLQEVFFFIINNLSLKILFHVVVWRQIFGSYFKVGITTIRMKTMFIISVHYLQVFDITTNASVKLHVVYDAYNIILCGVNKV